MPVGATGQVMGQVAVNLNGRNYRFDCGDGEEPRLKELAAYVKNRFDSLAREFGNVGEDRLMLMAALLIADELWDARAALGDDGAGNAKPGNGEAKPGAQKREQGSARADLNHKPPAEAKKSA